MGMGEPMDNYEAVRQSIEVLTADWGLAWSPQRITVSTVGVIPTLKRLLDETRCHVAVSLHSPFSDEREELMPVERAYPIAEVVDMLRRYNWRGQRRISFEYIMFRGLNDDILHAAALCSFLCPWDLFGGKDKGRMTDRRNWESEFNTSIIMEPVIRNISMAIPNHQG